MAVIKSHGAREFPGLLVREQTRCRLPRPPRIHLACFFLLQPQGPAACFLSQAFRPDKTLHRDSDFNVSLGRNLLRKRNPVFQHTCC